MTFRPLTPILLAVALSMTASANAATPAPPAEVSQRVDLLSFAQGAVPVAIIDDARALKVGMDQALQIIDGNAGGFGLTPKPGGRDAEVSFVYELPAATTFDAFAVPNVLETPSPSQTFFKTVTVSGSDTSADGPFHELANTTLATHAKKGEVTKFPASAKRPVRWVRVTLAGGINIERDKTFFEFSELMAYGTQAPVAPSDAFTGKWKGRGVKMELHQDGVRVEGCYDNDGELEGTVSGNLLRATGKARTTGVPSTFVLSVDNNGEIFGVRSANGAPFRLYKGAAAPALRTQCSEQTVQLIGCGSIVHGINFDFDSAVIRPESDAILDALYEGLASSSADAITLIGHTSSEGAEAYNEALSQRRAESVASALAARGIDAARISAQGRGEKQPIADNSSEAGRVLNRRVEIECH